MDMYIQYIQCSLYKDAQNIFLCNYTTWETARCVPLTVPHLGLQFREEQFISLVHSAICDTDTHKHKSFFC